MLSKEKTLDIEDLTGLEMYKLLFLIHERGKSYSSSSKETPDNKTHSFFGPMFLRKSPYINDYDGFPEMRQ